MKERDERQKREHTMPTDASASGLAVHPSRQRLRARHAQRCRKLVSATPLSSAYSSSGDSGSRSHVERSVATQSLADDPVKVWREGSLEGATSLLHGRMR